jgi:hypothetical protein
MPPTTIESAFPTNKHPPQAEEEAVSRLSMADTEDATRRGREWTRGEQVVVAAGVLLILDLLVLPWHHFSLNVDLERFGIDVPSFTFDRRGVQNPQAFFGIAAVVVAAAMVLHILARKVRAGVPRYEQLHLIAGPVAFGLLVAKLLANDAFLGVGAWVGTGLAAVLAFGGFLISQEATTGPDRSVPQS